jgi:hypothetical protein
MTTNDNAIIRENCPDSLDDFVDIDIEALDLGCDFDVNAHWANETISIGGTGPDVVIRHSLTVDTDYHGTLTPAQLQLWEVLAMVQTASIYAVLTVGKLATVCQTSPLSIVARLENLTSVGAVSGWGVGVEHG